MNLQLKIGCLVIYCFLLIASQSAIGADAKLIYIFAGSGKAAVEIFIDEPWRKDKVIFSQIDTVATVDDSVAALNSYYLALAKEDYATLERLYTKKDGSRERLRSLLSSNPKAYSNYTNLRLVKQDFVTFWGAYEIHGVHLFGAGQDLRWREALYCEPREKCLLSNTLDNISYEERYFIEALSHFMAYLENKNKDDVTNGRSFNDDDSFVVLPSESNSFVGVQQYPIRVYLEPYKLPNGVAEFSEECGNTDVVDDDQKAVLELLCDAVHSVAEEDVKLDSIFGISKNTLLPVLMYDDSKRVKQEESQSSPIERSSISRVLYSLDSYRYLINRWRGVRFLGKVTKEDGSGVVYFKPVLKEGELPVQAYGVYKDKGKKKKASPMGERYGGILFASSYAALHMETYLD